MNSVRSEEAAAEALVRMVDWAQSLLVPALAPGDLAVDLTAGTGRDTLFLFRRVGPTGRILSFDIQEPALTATERLLTSEGAAVDLWHAPRPEGIPAGVHLVHDTHARLEKYLDRSPAAIVANFGYLPGGDHRLATQSESSLAALRQGVEWLRPGGRLAVVLYIGHAGGAEEGEAIASFFAGLPSREWLTLRLEVPNRSLSPFLLVAEKR